MAKSLASMFLITLFMAFSTFANAELPPKEFATSETLELITRIEKSGVTFIRNGDQHSSKEAADHLASKVKKAKKKGMTAEQFIEKIASKSSSSGKPYQIVMRNGKTVNSEDWLLEQLAEIRHDAPPVMVDDSPTSATTKKDKPKKEKPKEKKRKK